MFFEFLVVNWLIDSFLGTTQLEIFISENSKYSVKSGISLNDEKFSQYIIPEETSGKANICIKTSSLGSPWEHDRL